MQSRLGMFSVLVATFAITGCSATINVQPDDSKATASSTAAEPSATATATAVASASAQPSALPIGSVGNPGDWVKPNPKGKANGDACAKPDDCKSGVCEGEGCTTGPKCVPADRICTRDLVTFCGCDGKPFQSSGGCPGRPFAKRGLCSP